MKATVLRFTAILAVVMGFTAVSVYPQGVAKQQTFVVPFEFSVGQEVLSPGEYTVIGETQIVRIQSKDRKQSVAVVPVRTVGAPHVRSEAKLTFRRYGDQYYLSQIWLPDGIGRELKRKRRANSELAQTWRIVEVSSTR